jgi:hypothetical protein
MLGRCLLPVLVVAGLAACRNAERSPSTASADRSARWTPARVAELYFSTGVNGYIEPCGCTSQPLGGVQRLATVLEAGHENRVLVDAGNLLFPLEGLDETTRDQHLLKARLLSRAYRMFGAVALNLGESDLAGGGAELLKDLQREGALPLVSANVRPVGDSGPAVAQSFLREVGGIKIGITGVSTPEAFRGIKAITAIEYAPALRAEVAQLRKRGAEILVVLANIGRSDAQELARGLQGVDVMVWSPGTKITRSPSGPARVGEAVLIEAGSQGQHIGRLTLRLGRDPPVRPLPLDDGGYSSRRRRELNQRKLGALRAQVASWASDPKKKAAIASRKAQIARLERAQEGLKSTALVGGPAMRVELVPLTEEVAADPEASSLLKAYYARLKELNLSKGDVSRCKPAAPGSPVFTGSARCAECHEEAFEFWKKTKHAQAWGTLTSKDKQYDLTCIGCHSVGYMKKGGFCRLSDVDGFENVGCEECHGPGSVHVGDGEAGSIRREAPEALCRTSCHVPEHSDGFDYANYVLKVTDKGHALTPPPAE